MDGEQTGTKLVSHMPTGSVTSKDDTRIGYLQMGDGPGLVLVHGALQSSRNFTKLGAALADTFTVYIPDRRGRGLSGPFGDGYCMRTEVEDLAALLAKTGVNNIFALSSGALIALQAALAVPAIRKMALYEPPLAIDGQPSPMAWVPRYAKALAAGNLPAALVAVIKGTGDRELLTYLPSFLLRPIFKIGLRYGAQPNGPGGPTLQELIPTVLYDTRLVAEMAGRIETFKAVHAQVLLLGGTRSAASLSPALDAIATVLASSERFTFAGLGHLAADNTGTPTRVADQLRRFFA